MIRLAPFLLLVLPVLSFSQWTKLSFPTTEFLWKVRFATEETGWIAGHTFIYRTTNGGQTWTPQDSTKGSVYAMAVINDSTMFYARYASSAFPKQSIRRTTDRGITWTTVDTGKYYYDDIEMIDGSVGYICGGTFQPNVKPIVAKTTDGGATWIAHSVTSQNAKYELTGLSFIDVNTGWGVTYDGFIYKTTNGGSNWNLLDSIGANSYRDIAFVNQNYGWIVGGISGLQKLAYTTNGGTAWTVIAQNGSSTREVEFVDSNNVWFAGSNNGPPFIAHYDTIGGSWKTQDINDKFTGVESIDMLNAKVGYAAGGQGAVYKTTTGGVLAIQPAALPTAPVHFSLGQNFPNPFNPSTTIPFSLPARGSVTLKIHSITGQLVDVLLDGMMDAGTHRIQWNAAHIPSGIYFYTLTIGYSSHTRGLVLMK